jgi:glycosyltransferase involved in cell wall biosynthesis
MSAAFGELLIAEYGVARGRVHVVPPGIDPARFPLLDRRSARESLGLRDEPTIVTVRRLVARMGIELAISAVAQMPADERPLLVIGGTGPDQSRLERLAAEEGVADRVQFFGFVPDERLAQFYAAGDACVVPSRELEGFGYGALEALAAGTPVVAARTGGLVELVGALERRWLVEWDAGHLAAGLSDVLRDLGTYPTREACRAYAARFAWPEIAARTLDVFRRAEAAQASAS